MMEKYGQFAIFMANLSRETYSLEHHINDDFTLAYHTAVQHAKFNNKKSNIDEKEMKNLPHCVYLLKRNWLKAM